MSSNGSLQAIIFDYGKVLTFPPTEQDWANLRAPFGVSAEKFQEQYWGYRDAYDRADLDGPAYWTTIAQLNGVTLTPEQIERHIELDNQQWTRINPEMLDFARRTKARGVKTGILSNMQFEMLSYMRKHLPWLDEFDVQMYSCEIGVTKPDAKSYLTCVDALGVIAEKTLFIDDKVPNVEGAKKAGLQAVLFSGDRSVVEKFL